MNRTRRPATNSARRRIVRTGRAALMWTLATFVAGQAAGAVWLYRCHRDMINPVLEFRYARLQARRAESPGRPLLVVLGSSRPANGFCPSAMADWQPRNGPAPVIFNCAIPGGGPVRALLTYRQLRARGMRPDWVIVEAFAAFWGAEPGLYDEKCPIESGDQYLSDLPVLQRLYKSGWDCLTCVLGRNLTPVVHYRAAIITEYLPILGSRGAAAEAAWARVHWAFLDEWGWLPVGWPRVAAEEAPKQLKSQRDATAPALNSFCTKTGTDWAMRELLRQCRAEGTRLAVVLFPEQSPLRAWYASSTTAAVQQYLAGLSREYGVPVIDTRDWLDDDGFHDFAHMAPDGARAYSARFGREVLRPLLEGTPLPEHCLLGAPTRTPSYEDSSSSPPPAQP